VSEHDHDGPAHSHGAHSHAQSPASRLLTALALTTSFLVIEAIAGWLTGSLALLSDAGHMLTDAAALGIAVLAQRLADRPRTAKYTFGLRRAETLAALVNGVVLGVSAVWVIVEAVKRFRDPPVVAGGWMLVVASTGLVVNLISAWMLSRGQHTTNLRAALAHVLADAAGSVAAMTAGAAVVWFGWTRADPIVSIIISLLILWGSWGLVRGTTLVLLETTPAGIDPLEIEKTIRATSGVADVHDLHVWSIADGYPLVSAHVVLRPGSHGVEVANAVVERVRAQHAIEHVTIQPESAPPPLVPLERLRR